MERLTKEKKQGIQLFCLRYPYFVQCLESATELSSAVYVSSSGMYLDPFLKSSVEEAAMLRITYREYIHEIESSAKEFGDSVEHILELMKNGDPDSELDNFYSILDKRHPGGYSEWYYDTRE